MLRKLLLVFCLVCGCLQVAAQGKLSNVKVEDADGKLVEISSLVNGKPFIMSFWGITCKPCLMELNAINDQLEEWMNEEKWFTADEAVEFGFADSVKRDNAESVESEESIEDIINSKVAIAMAAFSNSQNTDTHEVKTKSLIARLQKGENT